MTFESCTVNWPLNEHEAMALLRLLKREADRVEKPWQPFWQKQAETLQAALEQAELAYRQRRPGLSRQRWQQLLANGSATDSTPGEADLWEAGGGGAEAAELAVEDRLHFLVQLLQAVEQALIATDLSGRVFYWNRCAETIYGWQAAEAIGRCLPELIAGFDESGRESAIMDSLQQGRQWTGELPDLRRNGSSFWARITASPAYDRAGELVGIIRTVVDISERKQLGGLLPICASCKKIRDDQGYWQQVEVYIRQHSEAEFSHGLCPDCKHKLYPEAKYPYLYGLE